MAQKRRKIWTVSGKVFDAGTEQGVAGVLVEAFDQDNSIEERLGSVTTDDAGGFSLQFDSSAFQRTDDPDSRETRPELFCRVRDKDGRLLAQTEVRRNAGAQEVFLIGLDGAPAQTLERLARDRVVLTRPDDTLTGIARRYYRLAETGDDAKRKARLKAIIARLKENTPELTDLGPKDRLTPGTRVTLADDDDTPLVKDIVQRDVYVQQLGRLGMDTAVAELFVDRLNVKGIAGLAKVDYGEIITRWGNLQNDPCSASPLVLELPPLQIYTYAKQARFYTRGETPRLVSAERVKLSLGGQQNLAKVVQKVTPDVVVMNPGLFFDDYQNSRLQTAKSLLKKAGVCDISKVGTLRLSHNMDLQYGLYLPEPPALVDPGYLNWLETRFTAVEISSFSHTRVASMEWPMNEAVLIATELDLTDKEIVIDPSIDTFYIIAERIIYGDGAKISYSAPPVAPATEYSRRAADGVDYNINSYAGGGNRAYDGGDGQPGATGYANSNDGRKGPDLEIYTLELPGGLPDIDLGGQRGGKGGRGQQGGNGGDGSRGRTAHGHWYSGCSWGPGFGGDGGDGGKGGMGGRGGAGGAGGSLTVGVLTENLPQIYSRPTHLNLSGGPAGEPGSPGLGGSGGRGGRAGDDGSWDNWCSAQPERHGNDGSDGALGDEYPPDPDPERAADGLTAGHGAPGEPGILNPPVLYTQDEWNLMLNQPWILRLDPNRSVPSRSATDDRRFVFVEGNNFTASDVVYIDGGPVATTYLTEQNLRFEVAFDMEGGSRSVHVRQSDGTESNRLNLTVLPRLDAADATDVIPGQEVTLSGRAFVAGARVDFAGQSIVATTVSRDTVVFSLPTQSQLADAGIDAGTYPVKVINPDGEQTDPLDLTLDIPYSRIVVPVVAHRIYSEDDPTIGTNASEADIRDIFDNSDTQNQRIGYSINHLMSQTGIQFVLVEIQDHQVRDDWVSAPFPADDSTGNGQLRTLSGMFNVDFQLDMYFLVSFDLGGAWGGRDTEPAESGQTGAVWMGNVSDVGPARNTRRNWQSYISIVAQEIGHFLTLPHYCSADPTEDTWTDAPCTAVGQQHIMWTGNGAGAVLIDDDEIAQARDRAREYDIS